MFRPMQTRRPGIRSASMETKACSGEPARWHRCGPSITRINAAKGAKAGRSTRSCREPKTRDITKAMTVASFRQRGDVAPDRGSRRSVARVL